MVTGYLYSPPMASLDGAEGASRARIWCDYQICPLMCGMSWFLLMLWILRVKFIGIWTCEPREMERTGFARILVEVPLEFEPVPEIEIPVALENAQRYMQVTEYEKRMKFYRIVDRPPTCQKSVRTIKGLRPIRKKRRQKGGIRLRWLRKRREDI